MSRRDRRAVAFGCRRRLRNGSAGAELVPRGQPLCELLDLAAHACRLRPCRGPRIRPGAFLFPIFRQADLSGDPTGRLAPWWRTIFLRCPAPIALETLTERHRRPSSSDGSGSRAVGCQSRAWDHRGDRARWTAGAAARFWSDDSCEPQVRAPSRLRLCSDQPQ
jgi:hypothetical protein